MIQAESDHFLEWSENAEPPSRDHKSKSTEKVSLCDLDLFCVKPFFDLDPEWINNLETDSPTPPTVLDPDPGNPPPATPVLHPYPDLTQSPDGRTCDLFAEFVCSFYIVRSASENHNKTQKSAHEIGKQTTSRVKQSNSSVVVPTLPPGSPAPVSFQTLALGLTL